MCNVPFQENTLVLVTQPVLLVRTVYELFDYRLDWYLGISCLVE